MMLRGMCAFQGVCGVSGDVSNHFKIREGRITPRSTISVLSSLGKLVIKVTDGNPTRVLMRQGECIYTHRH